MTTIREKAVSQMNCALRKINEHAIQTAEEF